MRFLLKQYQKVFHSLPLLIYNEYIVQACIQSFLFEKS